MIFFELFWAFVQVGFASFGGASMVPLISRQMIGHGWMTVTEVSDIVAIAEMTPGPMGANCASFAGMRVAGVPGALAANLGVVMPTFTLCLLVAIFFEKFKEARRMQDALYGIRPACVGMLAAVMVSMAQVNYTAEGMVSWQAILIGAIAAVVLMKFKQSVPRTILLCAVLGILLIR